ncbi:meiosis specific protein Hop1 [Aspergillus avenaceus]|uniref:Meiosis specific protein Hop1 n=1 Tax=Aspergillus avenaceus TaxID=36643 RepID=A0A5N6TPK6_ASPAV|nr:meiosis specific protein Hop1 [Aspergillus avenaceus]
MARIKFTAPASAVQLESAQVLHEGSNGTPIQKNIQIVENLVKPAVSEGLLLKQQQSLEMVQIMLHVSFGTLFYLRELLPLPCFDDRDLKEAQREHRLSYRGFIDAKVDKPPGSSEIAFGSGKRGQPLKVIIRGSDPKADMILDVLENGIFDAIQKNILEAIQLTILVDKDTPENVLESYTFSFKYTGGPGNLDSCLESLTIDPVGCMADMKSTQSARVGLETIVRRLITLSAFLPALPNKRNLGVHLFYTENCPSEYEPPGFTTTENDTIKYPLDENWRKETQSCGTMNSGWHTVGLKVTSLKWTGPDPEGSEALPTIPSQLEYSDVVSRTEDIGFVENTSLLYRSETGKCAGSEGTPALNQSSYCVSGSFQEATQDIAERQRLQMMMPAQGTHPYPDSDLIPTQPINPAAEIDRNYAPFIESRWVLSEKRIADIREHVGMRKSSNVSNDFVRCQCGWEGEEADMVECTFCHSRQHLLCYGFEGREDPRIPDVHACYACLLEPKETKLLSEMNTLVLLRRAIKIMLDDGYPKMNSEFAQKLHCNGETIVQITDMLKRQGFIRPTPGYKLKGFARRGLPRYSVPLSENIRQRLVREITHPMVKIQHHYAQLGPHGPSISSLVSNSQKDDNNDEPTDGAMKSTNESRSSGVVTRSSTRERPESQGKRRSPTQSNDSDRYKSDDDLEGSDRAADEQLRNSILTSEGMEPNVVTPNRQIPSGQGPRRSSRKRRKISNYSKLIDVGAETSENETF